MVKSSRRTPYTYRRYRVAYCSLDAIGWHTVQTTAYFQLRCIACICARAGGLHAQNECELNHVVVVPLCSTARVVCDVLSHVGTVQSQGAGVNREYIQSNTMLIYIQLQQINGR